MNEEANNKIRELDLGEGVEFSITSHKSEKDKKGRVTKYFSNKLSKVKTGASNALRELEVEVSSTEAENNDLLHYLFDKTRQR